ncbi:MAG: redoxin domain-containing protein [Lacibacter sp.]
MKQALVFWAVSCLALGVAAQGYRITARYKPLPNGYLYLGFYYGDKKYLHDSARLQADGSAVFAGDTPLTGGLYIIVDPQKQQYFDVLIDREQQFSLQIDTAHFTLAGITGSTENAQLDAYQKATQHIFRDVPALQQQLATARNRADSSRIEEKIQAAYRSAQQWRDSFITAQPDSYLALLFRLLKEPVYDAGQAKTHADSLAAYYRYKQQFWENIALNDERLLRTPMFEQRLTRYFEQVVVRHPDSLKREVDRFILPSRSNQTMFRYYITRFTNEYMNPKYMGLDVVFLHLFEKYYLTHQVDWLDEKNRDLVYNRAYSLMGNIVGEPAAELELLNPNDKPVRLYNLPAPYTVLVFWDPDCGHCREQVPVIDSLHRTRWKQMGVQLVGVLVDTLRSSPAAGPQVKANWVQFIQKHRLNGWIHLYQPFEMRQAEIRNRKPGFRQNYDVYQTPTIYLLDKDKRIVAKKIGPEQLDELLTSLHQQRKHP